MPPKDLSLFYVTCIRSVMDYGVVSYLILYLSTLSTNLHELERESFPLYCPDMII